MWNNILENMEFGYITAAIDCFSVVLVIMIMQVTLTVKNEKAKWLKNWAGYIGLFFLIDGVGYTVSYIVGGGLTVLGDLVAMGTMAFLLMLPAKKLYKEHFTSNIFILELAVLIALIGTYLTGVVATGILNKMGIGYSALWMISYGVIKIPVLALFYLIYRIIILNPAKDVVNILNGKMGRYIPVALASIALFYAFGAVTGYTPDNTLQFSLLYLLVCITFSVMYWLIFSGAIWTSRALKTETELGVASKIQKDMLPGIFPAFPGREEFDIYATMEPAKEVGGDFYDFFLVDEDHLAVVMADVSGKGVPAALFMVIAKTIIKNHAQTGLAPEKVLEEANRQLCENNDESMFVTVFIGIYEISPGRFSYSNGGHNAPLLMRKGMGWDWLETKPGFVVAGMEGMKFKLQETVLGEGDMLYFYTDGVTEAQNKKEELYSDPRLLETINKIDYENRTLEGLLKEIRFDIDLFANGAEQADDITMLALRIDKIGGKTV